MSKINEDVITVSEACELLGGWSESNRKLVRRRCINGTYTARKTEGGEWLISKRSVLAGPKPGERLNGHRPWLKALRGDTSDGLNASFVVFDELASYTAEQEITRYNAELYDKALDYLIELGAFQSAVPNVVKAMAIVRLVDAGHPSDDARLAVEQVWEAKQDDRKPLYYVGAKSRKRAEQIAEELGLERSEWRRAHGGQPARLLDGLQVEGRKYLVGEFTPDERWVLTAHLEEEEER